MDIAKLFRHLNRDAQSALNTAAEDAARERRQSVSIERFLLALLRERRCAQALARTLEAANAQTAAMESALARAVAEEPTNALAGVLPRFSTSLATLLGEARALTFEEYGEDEIAPARFFETVARRGDAWPRLVDSLPGFARIDLSVLTSRARVRAGEDDAGAPAVPVRSSSDERYRELSRFGYDFIGHARAGRLDPVVGFEREMGATGAILLRRAQNCAVIVGESGVGKSACAFGLIEAIAHERERAPRALFGTEVWALDLARLRASAAARGALEEHLQEIASEVAETQAILFIDDLHLLFGEGARSGADALRAMAGSAAVRLLATCSWKEWRRYIEPDPALARRLAPVRIAEPDDAQSERIVGALAEKLAEHHGVHVDDGAVKSAVALSRRYIVARHLPDKAVATLDSACARARMHAPRHSTSGEQGDMQAQEEGQDTRARVEESHVADVISELTGVPVGAMLTDVGRTAAALETTLRERVVGQDEALARCATQARAYLAGLSDLRRPVGALMLCGPSGTGKTETAHALADALFGGRLLNVNMSEYQEAHTVSGLKGAPAGYVGFGEGGRLTEGIRQTPYCVLLLDEIEKAHRDVIEMLYQVLDKGWMEDAEGLEADFSNALIILTTNAGDAIVEAAAKAERRPSAEEMHHAMTTALARDFPPAFIGRLQVIPYWPLGDETLMEIAAMRLVRLAAAYERSHARALTFDESVHAWLATRVRTTPQGARFLDGIVARSIRPAVADYVLGEMAAGGAIEDIEVAMVGGKLSIGEPGHGAVARAEHAEREKVWAEGEAQSAAQDARARVGEDETSAE